MGLGKLCSRGGSVHPLQPLAQRAKITQTIEKTFKVSKTSEVCTSNCQVIYAEQHYSLNKEI